MELMEWRAGSEDGGMREGEGGLRKFEILPLSEHNFVWGNVRGIGKNTLVLYGGYFTAH